MFTYSRRAKGCYQGNRQKLHGGKNDFGDKFATFLESQSGGHWSKRQNKQPDLLISLFSWLPLPSEMAAVRRGRQPKWNAMRLIHFFCLHALLQASTFLDQTKLVCSNHRHVLSDCHSLVIAGCWPQSISLTLTSTALITRIIGTAMTMSVIARSWFMKLTQLKVINDATKTVSPVDGGQIKFLLPRSGNIVKEDNVTAVIIIDLTWTSKKVASTALGGSKCKQARCPVSCWIRLAQSRIDSERGFGVVSRCFFAT